MGLILYSKYFNIDIIFKQVDCDIYYAALYVHGYHDYNDYTKKLGELFETILLLLSFDFTTEIPLYSIEVGWKSLYLVYK